MRLKINTYPYFCQIDVVECTVLMSVSEKSVFYGRDSSRSVRANRKINFQLPRRQEFLDKLNDCQLSMKVSYMWT